MNGVDVRSERLALGLTLAQFGTVLGCGLDRVWRIERGITNATAVEVRLIRGLSSLRRIRAECGPSRRPLLLPKPEQPLAYHVAADEIPVEQVIP